MMGSNSFDNLVALLDEEDNALLDRAVVMLVHCAKEVPPAMLRYVRPPREQRDGVRGG